MEMLGEKKERKKVTKNNEIYKQMHLKIHHKERKKIGQIML